MKKRFTYQHATAFLAQTPHSPDIWGTHLEHFHGLGGRGAITCFFSLGDISEETICSIFRTSWKSFWIMGRLSLLAYCFGDLFWVEAGVFLGILPGYLG
jgi:hypothetical protein